ncbi:MAG: CapA family protein [Nitrospirota bacterium]|nr:CapA family protein [Nitrospirota bacterium]
MNRLITTSAFALLVAFTAAAQERADDTVTVAAVGDIMLGHRAEPYLQQKGPGYPFVNVLPVLRSADLVIGNQECPISSRGEAVPDKKFTLRVGQLGVDALKEAGIRVVTLANNHILDFGPLALQDTLAALSGNGILFTGAGMDLDDARAPAFLKVKDRAIAFLSYSLTFPLEFYASRGRPGTAPGYADFVRADIAKVRERADLVVVSFHWGAELMTAAKDYQVDLGRKAIDWGADLVLGHHPHILQELELYKGRLIAYSLGNFTFGSESDKTNTSIILLCTFRGKTLERVEAVPIDVNNYRVAYQPRVLNGAAGAAVVESINKASARFGTRLTPREGWGEIVLSPAGAEPTAAPRNSPRILSGPEARSAISDTAGPASASAAAR